MTKTLQFHPVDTWFFREAKPFDSIGGSELGSVFPPPISTVQGALRRYLGDAIGINWQAFGNGDAIAGNRLGLDFKAAVGDANGLGQLQLKGVWLNYQGQRLYPVPAYLLANPQHQLARLSIGTEPVHCDLGRVRLARMPEHLKDYKPLQHCWLTAQGWQTLLNGETPGAEQLITACQLFKPESRLGIALNPKTRSVQQSQLYQTQHIRPLDNVCLELDVDGLSPELADCLPAAGQFRRISLGGEARMADLTVSATDLSLPTPNHLGKTVILHFITPADFDGKAWPQGFESVPLSNGQDVWQGTIEGIAITVESVVMGKAHREGGWNLQANKPRPVNSLLPAGTAWFCRTDQPQALLKKLHGQCLGKQTAYGRGQVLLGIWNDA